MAPNKVKWICEEIRYFTILALPPSISYLLEGLQLKLGNVFIGRASGENVQTMLSALFIGQIVMLCTGTTISEGLNSSVNILCSQAYSKKQHKLVGLYYYRVLLLMILICFPLFSLLISVERIVYFFTQDRELSHGAGTFTSIYCLGFPAFAYINATIRFLQSQNIVWGPLPYLLLGNIVNGILQYMLILHFNLGIAGAAAGYVISTNLIGLLIFAHIRFSGVYMSTAVEFNIELISEWIHTAKYIISPTIQTLISYVASNVFPVILLLLISHSKNELAIYSILYSMWCMISLCTIGFSSAITVRVGHLLGKNDIQQAKRSAIFGIVFGEIWLSLICMGAMALSGPLSQLFTTDPNFADELYYNFLIIPILILTDIIWFGQGVMNGCGMHNIQAILKFLFITVLSFVVQVFSVRLFEWKALCIVSLQSFFRLVCFTISVIIVFSRKWNSFVLNPDSNPESDTSRIEIQHLNSTLPQFIRNSIVHRFGRFDFLRSSSFLIFRYITCLTLGISTFCFIYVKS